MTIRLRDLALVVLSIALEAVLLIGLWSAAPVLGSVNFSHLGTWIHTTDPATALLAVLRLIGMILAAWMLITTVVYLAATIAGVEGLARRSAPLTLPIVRRLIDGLAAASVLASALHSTSGASASPITAAPIVQPFNPPPAIPRPVATVVDTPSSPAMLAGQPTPLARHIPHPGVIEHAVLAAYRNTPPTLTDTAPSAANGFAGLAPGTKVVVVQPGDCLSIIAERHLSGNWQTGDEEIHALNAGRIQPDGRTLTDDHWIYPGWVLVMPDTALDTIVVPPPPQAHPVTPKPTPRTPPKPKSVPRLLRPVAPAPPTGSARGSITLPPVSTTHPHANGSARPAPPRPTTSREAPTPSRRSHHNVVSLPAELVGAGLLSAGLVTLLTRLAVIANGRRRRDRRSHSPSADGARVELAARVGADFDTVNIVDLGAKFLAVQLAGAAPPPPIVAVQVTHDWLAFLLGEPVTRAPDSFDVGAEGQSWIIPQPERLLAVADQLAEVVAPFPTLVSLGRTTTGITVLLNLGSVGLLTIHGHHHRAAETVTAAAVELATLPWSQQSQIILVGFGHTQGLGLAEPVIVVDSLEQCMSRLQASAAGLQNTSAEAGGLTIDQLRLTATPTDLDPSVVICLDSPDTQALAQLSDLANNPASGLGAVLVAGDTPTDGWRLEIDANGLLDITPLATTVDANRIPLPLFDAIEERISDAADTSDTALEDQPEDWWPALADSLPPSEVLPLDDEDLSDIPDQASEHTEPDHRTTADDPIEEPEAGQTEAQTQTNPPGRVRRIRAAKHPYPYLPPTIVDPLPEILVQVLTSEPRVLRRVDDRYQPVPVGRARALEAIAYLACHPEGVSPSRLAAALQPELAAGQTPPERASTFGTVLSAARKALGSDPAGDLCFPHKTANRLRLTDRVMLDWHVLLQLRDAAGGAPSQSRIELLTNALDLLDDETPLAETRRLGQQARRRNRIEYWRWFHIEILGEIERAVTDIARDLADLHEQAGDHQAASATSRRGLQISPLDRDLTISLLSAEAAQGPTQLQLAWKEVERVFETEGEPYDHLDNELRQHYLDLLDDVG
jgi:LysM domain